MSSTSKIIQFLFVIALSVFGYYLLGLYVNGDQLYYRSLYSEYSEASFVNAFELSFLIIGSSEPLSIIPLWIGAKLDIDKDIYISFFNFLLLMSFWLLCRKFKLGLGFTLLILTNYYTWVLMTGAERLKFAFILINFGFIISNKIWAKRLLLLSSLGAHFQSGLILLCLSAYKEYNTKIRDYLNFRIRSIFFGMLVILFSFVIYYFFFDNIRHKIYAYSENGDIYDLIKPLILFLITIGSLKNFRSGFRVFVVIAPFFYVFGDDRMTMIYFMVLFYLQALNGTSKFSPFHIVMLYFSFKTIDLMLNIYTLGTGFK